MTYSTLFLIAGISFLTGMASLAGIFILFQRYDPYTLSEWLQRIHPRLAVELAYWKEKSMLSSTRAKVNMDTCLDALRCLAGLGLGFHYHGDTILWMQKANRGHELDLYAPWRSHHFNAIGSVLRHINANTLLREETNSITMHTPLDQWANQEYGHNQNYNKKLIQTLEKTLPGVSAHSIMTLYKITFLLLYKFTETDFANVLDEEHGLRLIPYTTAYPESTAESQQV